MSEPQASEKLESNRSPMATSISVVRITQKLTRVTRRRVTHFIHSGPGLCFIFIFRPWHTVHQHMAWANCCESTKNSCGKWLQKWCQVLQACLIFKLPSFPNLENKNIDQKVPRFPTKTQKRFTKKKNIRPPSAEKMHWPSVMKGSVHQAFLHLKFAKGFGFSEAFGCVTYRWHPSQTRMR